MRPRSPNCLRKCIAALLFVASACCFVSQAAAQGADDMAKRLRQNTVRIESSRNGFGFITGERGGYLYIATARHTLISADQPDAPAPSKAKVYFYSDQGKSYDADVLGTHEGDLAVLKVKTPSGFQWIRECAAGPAKEVRGTQVWFVGRKDEWFVPVQAGAIASDQPSTRSQVEIDGLRVAPGTSGAPLIADTGIVGMILNDSEDDARAITLEFIERAFKGWNHPWDLRASTVVASGSHNIPTNVAAAPSQYEPPPVVSKSGPKTRASKSEADQIIDSMRGSPSDDSSASSNQPQTCSVTVKSKPAGAAISIDGSQRGSTPAKVQLVAGSSHSLSLSMPGYKDYSQGIECSSGTVNATLSKQSASVTLRYLGDQLGGCFLRINFNIGGKYIVPNGNPWTVPDVPEGNQSYTVGGTVQCPIGTCQAYGQGSVFIHDGAIFNVIWQSNSYTTCAVTLMPAQ